MTSNEAFILILKQLFIDRNSIDINTVVFLGKICSDRCKNHGCGQKNQKKLALPYLPSGPLPNAANSSDVPTKFAAELKKEKVLEDKFQFVS